MSSETQAFLEYLPVSAIHETVVALVRIRETPELDNTTFINVRVIVAISGVDKDEEIKVFWSRHSCSRDTDIKEGEEYFIAGSFGPDGYFFGEWMGIPPTLLNAQQPVKLR